MLRPLRDWYAHVRAECQRAMRSGKPVGICALRRNKCEVRGLRNVEFSPGRFLPSPWDLQARAEMTCKLPWGATIPLRPFFGILAVAPPPNYGLCSSVEPREFGGNLDNKEFLVGTSLYLPVFVPGANFSCGDGHAVQGDGEVCLTALETCLAGTFELILHKKKLEMPRAVTPTHYITMGLDPDLDDAAKQALRDMIRWLVEMKGWSSEEAYVFCSLASDLRVTQLVDGNKGIHAMVARNLV